MAARLSAEQEATIRERAEVGMQLDPKNDVVGQDYTVLLVEIDALRAVLEDIADNGCDNDRFDMMLCDPNDPQCSPCEARAALSGKAPDAAE